MKFGMNRYAWPKGSTHVTGDEVCAFGALQRLGQCRLRQCCVTLAISIPRDQLMW